MQTPPGTPALGRGSGGCFLLFNPLLGHGGDAAVGPQRLLKGLHPGDQPLGKAAGLGVKDQGGPAGAGDVMKVDTLSTTWALKTLHRIWLVVDGLGMGQSFAGAGTESIRSLARFQGAAGTRRKA